MTGRDPAAPELDGSRKSVVPQLGGLADAVEDVLLLVSSDGVIIDANQKARNVVGRDPVGLRIVDLFGVWAVAGFGDLFAVPPPEPEEVEAPLFTSEGSTIGYLWLVSASGEDRVALAGRELTHVYPLDLIRRLSNRVTELRDSDRAKQDILDMVAHEFKTPLTVIKGYAWLMEQNRDELSPEQVAEGLVRIQTSADRLLRLFDDVFTISQIDSGKLNVYQSEFDLVAMLREIAGSLKGTLAEGRIDIEAPDSIVVVQDPSKVVQVLTNLITNALKYAEGGSAARISVVRLEDRWAIRVFNRHTGLTAAELERLFERFSRLDRDRDTESRGLGLYIAQNLARRIGGEIRVESSQGCGVTFTFEMPDLPGE
jgi:signal transduction histidine kinase